MAVNETICEINDSLCKIFAGSKWYGVVELVSREGVVQPSDGHYDDSLKISGYHRIIQVHIVEKGFSNMASWDCVMVINNNTGIDSQKLVEVLISVFGNFRTVTLARIILNSAQIHDSEYRGTPYQGESLTQVNYKIQTAVRKNCCVLPEDC